jgi:predicted branched-subunit amino acid permease
MFLSRRLQRHPEFALGMRDMLPQATGLAAWGLMTGVAMVKSGMSVFESVLMTLLVFAGSSQLASIPLIVAGAPAWVILATGVCVNLRFVVFSLHLRPYLMHLPRWQRLLHGYLTADVSYVLFTRRFHQPGQTADEHHAREAYLSGNCFTAWLSWMVASLLGIALANLIPPHWGLGFAGILCLLGIMSSLASTRLRLAAAAVAGAAAVAAYALPLKLNIVAAIAVAVLVSMVLEKSPLMRAPGGPA